MRGCRNDFPDRCRSVNFWRLVSRGPPPLTPGRSLSVGGPGTRQTHPQGRGGLVALLIILVLLGGLVACSSLRTPPAEVPEPMIESAAPAAPESMTGGSAGNPG